MRRPRCAKRTLGCTSHPPSGRSARLRAIASPPRTQRQTEASWLDRAPGPGAGRANAARPPHPLTTRRMNPGASLSLNPRTEGSTGRAGQISRLASPPTSSEPTPPRPGATHAASGVARFLVSDRFPLPTQLSRQLARNVGSSPSREVPHLRDVLSLAGQEAARTPLIGQLRRLPRPAGASTPPAPTAKGPLGPPVLEALLERRSRQWMGHHETSILLKQQASPGAGAPTGAPAPVVLAARMPPSRSARGLLSHPGVTLPHPLP